MPILSKPCERSGCQTPITSAGKTPKVYARRRFCSNRCTALHRKAQGTWLRPVMTEAQRIEAGRKGGLKAGERKRRQAALRVSEALKAYITPSIEASLSRQDLARVKALLARAWNDGRTAEASRLRMLRREGQKKGQAA
jgi:hypothetical protein